MKLRLPFGVLRARMSPERQAANEKVARALHEASPTDELSALLYGYEKEQSKIDQLEEEYAHVFEAYEVAKKEQETIKGEMKRLVTSLGDKPKDGRKTLAGFAIGKTLQVNVQYKQARSYYDPEKLPAFLLAKKGVVKEVNAAAIETYLEEQNGTTRDILELRLKEAKTEGNWLTPSVSIRKLGEEKEDE